MLALLANPWSWVVIGASLLITHGAAYYQGRQDGGAHEALACEVRVSKLQGKYDEQAKAIEALNKQHKDALDAFIEGETQRAQDRQRELDEVNAKNDEYIAKLADSKKACILDDADIGVGGMQRNQKR